MGANGKILKCWISWKRIIIEINGWKFGSRGPRNCTCWVLFVSHFFTLVMEACIFDRFAKFLMLRFSGYGSHSFHWVAAKLYGKYGGQGRIQAIPVARWATLYETIAHHEGMQAISFLGNHPSLKNFEVLWNFNMGVNGKILKCAVCILKTDDCTVTWMKIGGLVIVSTAYVGYFSCRILWVQFAVIRCTLQISDVKISKDYSYHSFHPFHPHIFIESMVIRGEYRLPALFYFFLLSAKFKRFTARWR